MTTLQFLLEIKARAHLPGPYPYASVQFLILGMNGTGEGQWYNKPCNIPGRFGAGTHSALMSPLFPSRNTSVISVVSHPALGKCSEVTPLCFTVNGPASQLPKSYAGFPNLSSCWSLCWCLTHDLITLRVSNRSNAHFQLFTWCPQPWQKPSHSFPLEQLKGSIMDQCQWIVHINGGQCSVSAHTYGAYGTYGVFPIPILSSWLIYVLANCLWLSPRGDKHSTCLSVSEYFT